MTGALIRLTIHTYTRETHLTTKTKTPRLTHVEEIELMREYNCDNDRVSKRALDRLVLSNTGLVHKLTNKFPIKNASCTYDDLFQEGIAGLIHAITKFDVTKGYRLSTYCYRWIQAYLTRYFQNHSRSVRVPVHVADAQLSLNKQIEALTSDLGRTPTMSEITEINPEATTIIHKMMGNVSLNTTIGDDSELADVVGEDNTERFESEVDANIILSKLMGVVSPRDFTILQMRYGLGGYNESTLDEIGQRYEVSRARIHQILSSTLQKARTLV